MGRHGVSIRLLAIALLSAPIAVGASRICGAFEIEEATIPALHAAISSGEVTCKAVVEAYVARAKAFNGICTALVTADGKRVPATNGYIRAGAPLIPGPTCY